MRHRNIDLHGPKAPLSVTESRINGLEMRYEMNKQLISFWRSYQTAGRLLFREYDQSRAFPECCKCLTEGQEWASDQIVELQGIQVSLSKEIDFLRGQLPLQLPEEES